MYNILRVQQQSKIILRQESKFFFEHNLLSNLGNKVRKYVWHNKVISVVSAFL